MTVERKRRSIRMLGLTASLTLVLGLLVMAPAGADSKAHHEGTVHVYVYSDAGKTQTVPFVEVWLQEVPGQVNHYACTDGSGKATLEGITPDVNLIAATGKAGDPKLGCQNADFRQTGANSPKMYWMTYNQNSQAAGGFDNFQVSGGGETTITFVPVTPVDQTQVCAGLQVTMWATGGAFVGTANADVILGSGGPDTIKGLGGDDVICGDSGDDKLIGQAGDDFLAGGEDSDQLIGKLGNDFLFDNNWSGSVLKGGPGKDTLVGNSHDDTLIGGKDKDHIHGYGGDDTITGAHGNDLIWGGEGNDTVYAKYGYDKVWAGSGNDAVFGGDGNDQLWGESGDDVLRGANGDDILDGGTGGETVGDTLIGGTQGETTGDTCTNGTIVLTCNP